MFIIIVFWFGNDKLISCFLSHEHVISSVIGCDSLLRSVYYSSVHHHFTSTHLHFAFTHLHFTYLHFTFTHLHFTFTRLHFAFTHLHSLYYYYDYILIGVLRPLWLNRNSLLNKLAAIYKGLTTNTYNNNYEIIGSSMETILKIFKAHLLFKINQIFQSCIVFLLFIFSKCTYTLIMDTLYFYGFRFCSSWFNLPEISPWLEESIIPNYAYCKFCMKDLQAGKSELYKHLRTAKHRKKSEFYGILVDAPLQSGMEVCVKLFLFQLELI